MCVYENDVNASERECVSVEREGARERERSQSVSRRDERELYYIHCSLAFTIRHCLDYMANLFCMTP